MLFLVVTVSFLALASANLDVTSQCGPDGQDVCENGDFCVEGKFCLTPNALNDPSLLFVAGVASAFVQPNGVDEARCLAQISAEIDDFVNALEYWQQGDYESSGSSLVAAVTSFQSSVATCVSSATPNSGGFWDDLWDGVKYVVEALCEECDVIITDAELVIAGVDIIDDWATMYNDCSGQPTPDQLMDCGAAFGDSILRIANAARAIEAPEL